MKPLKFIYHCLLLVSFSSFSLAQTAIPSESTYLKKNFKTNYYVINSDSQGMLVTQDFILGEDHLNMLGISKEEMTKRFRIKYPAIQITPKPGTKFLTLDQLYEKFNISSTYQGYSVRIDNGEVINPKTMLAAVGQVREILVDKERKIVHVISVDFERKIGFNKRMIEGHKNYKEATEKAKREGRQVLIKKEGDRIIAY